MKLVKRQLHCEYREPTDQEWQDAYTRYLESHLMNKSEFPQELYTSFMTFRVYAHSIWHPLREIETFPETEADFVERIGKRKFTNARFISNAQGEIVSCVLF